MVNKCLHCFAVFFAILQLVTCLENNNRTTVINPFSSLDKNHERVLMRQKRYLLFPKGAGVTCTMSVVKALIINAPKGYNMLGEVDFAYPLPSSVSDVLKKSKRPKPATEPPTEPPTTTPPPPPDYHDYHHFSHEVHDVYPSSHELHDVYPSSHELHGIYPNSHEIHDVYPSSQEHPDLFSPPSGWKNDIIDNLSANRRTYQVSPNNPFWNGPQKWKAKEYNKNPSSRNYQRKSYKSNYYIPRGRSLDVNSQQPGSDFQENDELSQEAHRERRNLFNSLEGVIAGFNLQPCLLRTICEAQHFLMPKGKSLFHDIFRILFTMPHSSPFDDPYRQAMRPDKEDCHKLYAKKCPISLLYMFLQSERV